MTETQIKLMDKITWSMIPFWLKAIIVLNTVICLMLVAGMFLVVIDLVNTMSLPV